MTTSRFVARALRLLAPTRRTRYFGACVVLLRLVATWLSGEWASRVAMNNLVGTVHRVSEIQMLALRGTVAQYRHIPFMSAQSEAIVRLLSAPPAADQTAAKQQINLALEAISRRTGADALYVMDAEGNTLVASNWDDPKTFIGENYAFRPYFQDARAGGVGIFFAVGTSYKVPGLYVSVPVRLNGGVIGVVAVKVSLREIEDSWGRAGDPVALYDKHGIIFLGSQPEWTYKAVRPVSDEARFEIVRNRQYDGRTEFPLVPWTTTPAPEGYSVTTRMGDQPAQYLAIENSLPELGWTLVVMANQKSVQQARFIAMAITALLALSIVATASYWRQRERRMQDMRHMQSELEARVQSRTRELQEANAFRKSMEDSLLVGMRARDMQGRVTYVNAAMAELTGYSVEELINAVPPYPYWHPDDQEKDWQEYQLSMQGLAPRTGFESRYLHKNGQDVHTMVYTAPLINASGEQTGWMSSVVDITPQKIAEERQSEAELQRREIEVRIEKSAQLARLGEVSSILVHEITQPIAAISNFASAATAFAEQGRTELWVKNMDALKAQTLRAKEVIQRIQNWSKQRPPKFLLCDMPDIVERALSLMHNEVLRSKASVSTHFAPGLPGILADRVQIEQVLINLISNALQAMQALPPRQRRLLIEVGHTESSLMVRVADSGPGVAPEVEDKLFESFLTTKDDGLGLGLKICRTILETHGGRLTYERAADGGAVFMVVLPVRT
jgi:PAS domain S-box-containing protein